MGRKGKKWVFSWGCSCVVRWTGVRVLGREFWGCEDDLGGGFSSSSYSSSFRLTGKFSFP